jgi:hypothetical protein
MRITEKSHLSQERVRELDARSHCGSRAMVHPHHDHRWSEHRQGHPKRFPGELTVHSKPQLLTEGIDE